MNLSMHVRRWVNHETMSKHASGMENVASAVSAPWITGTAGRTVRTLALQMLATHNETFRGTHSRVREGV